MNASKNPGSNKTKRSSDAAPKQSTASPNAHLQQQTRKVMGKHYANKYGTNTHRTGRT